MLALTPILWSTGCSQTADERRASIYELQADPTEENRTRIRALLEDEDRDVRATALNALVSLDASDAAQLVLASLDDEDGFVRSMAAKLLGDLGDPGHVEALSKRLEGDPDVWVRRRAAEALTELGGPGAAKGLGRGLQDPMEAVRLASVTGVRKLDPRAFKAELAAMLLEDPAWEIRVQAARALALAGDPQFRPVIESSLTDENEFVRSAAANALKLLDEHEPPPGQAAPGDPDRAPAGAGAAPG